MYAGAFLNHASRVSRTTLSDRRQLTYAERRHLGVYK
jgi:hypothetical protein